jgi:hypothetical protein
MDQDDDDLAMLLILGGAGWRYRRCRRHLRQLSKLCPKYRYRPPFEYLGGSFDLDSIPEENQLRLFRFTASEIRLLAGLLQLDFVPWQHRNKPDPETALCVVLARLAFPRR